LDAACRAREAPAKIPAILDQGRDARIDAERRKGAARGYPDQSAEGTSDGKERGERAARGAAAEGDHP
jgi:hypothetical protein